MSIPKRSEALRERHLKMSANRRAGAIKPANERPARHQHGTVLEGIKTKPLRGGRPAEMLA